MLLIGLLVEALYVAAAGVITAQFTAGMARFEGQSPLMPTLAVILTSVLIFVAIVWGFLGIWKTLTPQDRKGWKKAARIAVGVVNLAGFSLLIVDARADGLVQFDWLQFAVEILITAVLAAAAFLPGEERRLSTDGFLRS